VRRLGSEKNAVAADRAVFTVTPAIHSFSKKNESQPKTHIVVSVQFYAMYCRQKQRNLLYMYAITVT